MTRQLLGIVRGRQKLSGSDAQNNGALSQANHISEAGQVSLGPTVAIRAHMQDKEPHMYSTDAAVLTVLRNWISSSPSPPSAMAAKEPVQQLPLAPLHSRY